MCCCAYLGPPALGCRWQLKRPALHVARRLSPGPCFLLLLALLLRHELLLVLLLRHELLLVLLRHKLLLLL